MRVSDYIVEFLIEQGVSDVFGYPGGMVTHLMDSFHKYEKYIKAHVTYHEQGAAFAACGYALTSGKPGVAYATSGPGATNLITGICNAYFDSIPTIFITGQVNTNELKGRLSVRQRGFQETEIVPMISGITKYATVIDDASTIKYNLEKAVHLSMTGRKGPVLLDIPMNIFRSDVNPDKLSGYLTDHIQNYDNPSKTIEEKNRFINGLDEALRKSDRPCFLLGNGVKISGNKQVIREIINQFKIPVVTSMLAFDILPNDVNGLSEYNFGFIGAYGDRAANFVVAKSDLIIALGARLDIRQVGANRDKFAPMASLFRIEIDDGELSYPVNSNEKQFKLDISDALDGIFSISKKLKVYSKWLAVCNEIKTKLNVHSYDLPNVFMTELSKLVPDYRVITTDVGQNQVWTAQSFLVKKHQDVFFSGGHGAMGFSLPAAIGTYYGSRLPVISISGDGGIQMNIQELQFIARENLPIKIVVFNNSSLGMIRHFQEMYFEKRYVQTLPTGGYSTPDFCAIASAYGIKSTRIKQINDLKSIDFSDSIPEVIEILLSEKTYVYPKVEFGKPNQDQEPQLDRDLYNYLMGL